VKNNTISDANKQGKTNNESLNYVLDYYPNISRLATNLTFPLKNHTTILDITNSVKFKHFKLHTVHSEVAYSTCIIQKIIHPLDWGQPLHQPISFPIHLRTTYQDFNTSYTYWDYQQAWFTQNLYKSEQASLQKIILQIP
jgi:hypothetical protein